MTFLGVEQIKGDPDRLDGRLTVYAHVDVDPDDLVKQGGHPIMSMVHNGLLVAQGNYRENSSLKDFLIKELGADFEGGLEDFVERLDGIEGALDPVKLKEKLESLDELSDFIPTPARIVPFGSVVEIMKEDGDVYCAGTYRGVAHANLSVNSIPILYQARFREQQAANLLSEIESMISQVEGDGSSVPERRFDDPGMDVGAVIMKELIPRMIYARGNAHDLEPALSDFYSFLKGYPIPQDIDVVERIVREVGVPSAEHYHLLDLVVRRIAAVAREDMRTARELLVEIAELEIRIFGTGNR